MVKNLPAMWEGQVRFLGWEDPPEKGMATHFRILAWRIPWTEEPGGLQSLGSQRVGHDSATDIATFDTATSAPFASPVRHLFLCLSQPSTPCSVLNRAEHYTHVGHGNQLCDGQRNGWGKIRPKWEGVVKQGGSEPQCLLGRQKGLVRGWTSILELFHVFQRSYLQHHSAGLGLGVCGQRMGGQWCL